MSGVFVPIGTTHVDATTGSVYVFSIKEGCVGWSKVTDSENFVSVATLDELTDLMGLEDQEEEEEQQADRDFIVPNEPLTEETRQLTREAVQDILRSMGNDSTS